MTEIQSVTGPDLLAAQVYAIWKIRDAVFSVEQQCTEPDVDDIDLLPTTTHLWTEDQLGISSYLRVYVSSGQRRIGRVATRIDARGRGLAAALIDCVHSTWSAESFEIGAQAHLEAWYNSFGYLRSGANYSEAGIDHLPMRREFR